MTSSLWLYAQLTPLGHGFPSVSYTHLRAHETSLHLVCRLLLEETRLEKQSKQQDQLYENDSVSTALAATPEEKKLLLCFYLRDGKPCPNGLSCAYSHKNEIIDKVKKAREEAQANKGKGKGKGKDKRQGKRQGQGQGQGKGQDLSLLQ